MLSVIIPTQNSERALVPTLAALVSGATAGLISEVLIADGGSQACGNITRQGLKQLKRETENWERMAGVIERVLKLERQG